MSQSGHVTVILVCTLAQAQPHLTKHLPGATTKEVGHYLAIQHPDLDMMGVSGAESLCYLNTLPMRTVAMRPAL